jgi:hypothetical protein
MAWIKVIASQRRVATGGQHFKHAFGQTQNTDIKGTAAQIIDSDNALLMFRLCSDSSKP